MSNLPGKLVDVRTIERNINRGLISREAYAEYLSNLEDSAEFAETCEVVFTYSMDEAEAAAAEAKAAAARAEAEAARASAARKSKAKPKRKRTRRK